MKTLILSKSDINNELHPFLWEEILNSLIDENVLPESADDYPETIELSIKKVEIL